MDDLKVVRVLATAWHYRRLEDAEADLVRLSKIIFKANSIKSSAGCFDVQLRSITFEWVKP